jgi:hypothetical protein
VSVITQTTECAHLDDEVLVLVGSDHDLVHCGGRSALVGHLCVLVLLLVGAVPAIPQVRLVDGGILVDYDVVRF